MKRLIVFFVLMIALSAESDQEFLQWLVRNKGSPYIQNGYLTSDEHIDILEMVFNKTFDIRKSDIEYYFVFFFKRDFSLIKMRVVSKGDHDSVSVPKAKILRLAKKYNAPVILCGHNHPVIPFYSVNWNVGPSDRDNLHTKKFIKYCNKKGILLLDEVVVAGNRLYSFRIHKKKFFKNHHPHITDNLKKERKK